MSVIYCWARREYGGLAEVFAVWRFSSCVLWLYFWRMNICLWVRYTRRTDKTTGKVLSSCGWSLSLSVSYCIQYVCVRVCGLTRDSSSLRQLTDRLTDSEELIRIIRIVLIDRPATHEEGRRTTKQSASAGQRQLALLTGRSRSPGRSKISFLSQVIKDYRAGQRRRRRGSALHKSRRHASMS